MSTVCPKYGCLVADGHDVKHALWHARDDAPAGQTTVVTQWDAAGDPLVWFDTSGPTPVAHDRSSGTEHTRPLTGDEAAIFTVSEQATQLKQQLAAGLAAIEQARTTAAAHVQTALANRDVALSLKSDSTTQKQAVTGFVAGLAYTPAQLTAVRDQLAQILAREELILQAFADLFTYLAANDQDAVLTHDATTWLGRLAAGELD